MIGGEGASYWLLPCAQWIPGPAGLVAHRVDGLGHQLAKPESYQPRNRWVTPLRVCPRLSSVITRLLSEGELLRVYWKNKNV